MSFTMDPAPIAWPSLSDLAHLLGVKLSTLSRLPDVRRRATRRIGREVKVRPADAVAILVERGLSEETAMTSVRRVIDHRQQRVPALRAPDRTPVVAPPDARLVRSSFRSTDSARLERSDLYAPRSPAQPVAPDMTRYEALDRRFADRVIPLERYIYDENR